MFKKLMLFIVAIATITVSANAQAPAGFKYQAVVRDAGNLILANQAVGMRMTLQQGTINGITVYSETFAVNTNEFGLVSLAIGTGTTAYDFSTIDWSAGPYFIETAIDVTGETAYTVMGTSQLMSVPYALHAKTTESLTGPLNETDPTFTTWDKSTGITITESQISNLTHIVDTDTQLDSTDITNLGYVAGGITTEVDGSITNEIQDLQLSGNNLTITNNDIATTIDLSPYLDDTDTKLNESEVDTFVANNGYITSPDDADSDPTNEIELPTGGKEGQILTIIGGTPTWVNSPCIVKVGDTYAGGIVFYVDASGCHGLVAAVSDQTTGEWGCSGTKITGADGTAIGTGNQNTIDIETGCATVGTAADICANLTSGGYSDWFLPSNDELNLMYQNIGQGNDLGLGNVGGFANNDYWSSTEYSVSDGWIYNFEYGYLNNIYKYDPYSVRAVRAF
jgi:hypothetical protein